MTLYRFLADVTVALHALYVGFVVFGLVFILLGVWRRWGWVRNFWFRIIHFAAIAVVAAEAALQWPCPLTVWEKQLREKAGEAAYAGDFLGEMAHRLLFYDAPQELFWALHCVFFLAVLATLVLAPPRWPWKKAKGSPSSPPAV